MPGPGNDHPGIPGRQQVHHFIHALVPGKPGDEQQAGLVEVPGQRRQQRRHRISVVRPVGHHQRRPGQHFHAARPPHSAESPGDGVPGNGVTLLGQRFQGCDGSGRVFQLVRPQQRNVQRVLVQAAADQQRLPIGTPAGIFPGHVFAHHDGSGAAFPAHGQNLRGRAKLLRAYHHRRAGLDDPRLFPGDFLNGVPQNFGVVHADRGDDANAGMHHVGGVQTTTQPDLDGLKIGLMFLEAAKTHRRHKLEQRHRAFARVFRHPFLRLPKVLHQLGKPAGVHRLPFQADAFPEGVHVGRGVKPGAVAGGAQRGVAKRRGAPLALGAGDVNCRRAQVGVRHPLQQRLHAGQVENELLARPSRTRPLVIDQGKQPVNRFLIFQRFALPSALLS